jgi:RNA polymerase sigma-70 factor (ECF subfamily)
MPFEADDLLLLYEAYAAGLLAFFLRHTFEPETAVDLLAETFAVAFEDRVRFERDSSLGAFAWLSMIAAARIAELDQQCVVERRAARRLGFQRRQLSRGEYELIEGLLPHEDLQPLLAFALAAPAEDLRRAVQLRIIEARPYAEVAQALGVSEQTARAWVSRGLGAARRAAQAASETQAA